MRVTKIEEHIHLIDLETAGIQNFIASYVIKGEQAAIVETGPTSSIPNLLSGLRQLDVKPEDVAYVAVSHIHLDHGGGVGTLLKHLPEAKVVVHQRGATHLANPEKLWQQSVEVLGKGITGMYDKPEPVPEEKIIPAADGLVLDIGNNIRLEIVETLGHASHHLSYYETFSEGVFPGDAGGIYLGDIDVIVPTTPSPFRLDIALTSLDKLISLKPKVLFYSHFGKAYNAVEKLQRYTRQLKFWAKIAKQELDRGAGLEEIAKKIAEQDAAVQKAREQIKVHPILSAMVLNESVRGFADFVSKFGAAPA